MGEKRWDTHRQYFERSIEQSIRRQRRAARRAAWKRSREAAVLDAIGTVALCAGTLALLWASLT